MGQPEPRSRARAAREERRRDGVRDRRPRRGYTAKVADACVIVPTVNAAHVTPHAEAFQAVVWHLFVTHPAREGRRDQVGIDRRSEKGGVEQHRLKACATETLFVAQAFQHCAEASDASSGGISDRDGVLNKAFPEGGTTRPPMSIGELELLPGVPESTARLRARLRPRCGDESAGRRTRQANPRRCGRDQRDNDAQLPLLDVFACFTTPPTSAGAASRSRECSSPPRRSGTWILHRVLIGDRVERHHRAQNRGLPRRIDRHAVSGAGKCSPDFRETDITAAAEWILAGTKHRGTRCLTGTADCGFKGQDTAGIEELDFGLAALLLSIRDPKSAIRQCIWTRRFTMKLFVDTADVKELETCLGGFPPALPPTRCSSPAGPGVPTSARTSAR